MNPKADKDIESHPWFPSGDWEGFYTYHLGPSASQHWMKFNLDFGAGMLHGLGCDDIGAFRWSGAYSLEHLSCSLVKQYFGLHDVHYDGYVDENGIWGKWHIGSYFSGGFHIWPRSRDHSEEKSEAASIVEKKTKVHEL